MSLKSFKYFQLNELFIPDQNGDTILFVPKVFVDIGANIGKDAGQSIMHCHIHLIPRRNGDVKDPRGGVRGVIPSKQKYERK